MLALPSQMTVSAAGWGASSHFHQWLVAHGVGQAFLQRLHVDDPGQGRRAMRLRVEMHMAAFVAMNAHAQHGRGMLGIGPGAQHFEQILGGGVERIGAHIAGRAVGRRSLAHQADAQPVAGQQQGQGPADDAGAADTNIGDHGGIVGG